jgi:hypothetical protein
MNAFPSEAASSLGMMELGSVVFESMSSDLGV